MPQFRYRAVTHAGEIVVGEVDASSREEVVRRIEYLGHLTIDAEIAATGILNRGRRSVGKSPRSRDVSIFLRQLSLLIGAGLTLEAALQTLGNDAAGGNEQDVVRIVAAESQPRIALFAFGIDLDLAEMDTEALRLLHMRGFEGEGWRSHFASWRGTVQSAASIRRKPALPRGKAFSKLAHGLLIDAG